MFESKIFIPILRPLHSGDAAHLSTWSLASTPELPLPSPWFLEHLLPHLCPLSLVLRLKEQKGHKPSPSSIKVTFLYTFLSGPHHSLYLIFWFILGSPIQSKAQRLHHHCIPSMYHEAQNTTISLINLISINFFYLFYSLYLDLQNILQVLSQKTSLQSIFSFSHSNTLCLLPSSCLLIPPLH